MENKIEKKPLLSFFRENFDPSPAKILHGIEFFFCTMFFWVGKNINKYFLGKKSGDLI